MLIVAASNSHLRFVTDSWLESYSRCRDCRAIAVDVYRIVQRDRIARCLESSRIVVATCEADPDLVIGWACGRVGRLHYVYVKARYRRQGVASELVRVVCGEGPIRYSHRGRIRPPAGWVYEPI